MYRYVYVYRLYVYTVCIGMFTCKYTVSIHCMYRYVYVYRL